jgi:hypothetical protein
MNTPVFWSKSCIAIANLAIISLVPLLHIQAQQTDAVVARQDGHGSAHSIPTNLTSFSQLAPLADFNQIAATNGFRCWLDVRSGWVSVYNLTTSNLGCLRMPATNLCRLVLLNKDGQEVPKTELGKSYGLELQQDEIDRWRRSWSNRTQSVFIRLTPGGASRDPMPTQICHVPFRDAFNITVAGDYELHVRLRLIQVGLDQDGNFHYPITWLPEIVASVHIDPIDLPKKTDHRLGTNSSDVVH